MDSSLIATTCTANTFPPVQKREILAWAGFDFANSSFVMITLTLVFPIYFTEHILQGVSSANFLWSLTLAISQLIVVAVSPFLGAWADLRARKKLFLFISYLGCVVFNALLAFVGSGDAIWAASFFVLANVSYLLGENFSSAFLPELSTPQTMGRLSAFGWGLGYLGSLVSLGLCLPLLNQGTLQATAATNLVAAGFFFLGGFPAFLILKERARPQAVQVGHILFTSWKRVWQTCRSMRQDPVLGLFFASFFLYMSGIWSVTSFFSLFAKQTLFFTNEELIYLLLVIQISAALGAFIFGWMQDRIGHITTIQISLAVWILGVITAYFVTSQSLFYLVANLTGLALGGCQSASRVVVGLLSPPNRYAEYFGLWGLFGKLAAAIGPLTFGAMNLLSGSNRVSIIITALFFIVAAGLLFFMPPLHHVKEPSEITSS